MKIKFSKICIALLTICLAVNIIFATTGLGTNVSMPVGGSGGNVNTMTDAETAVSRIWGSVKLILQILALSTILACGVRYMFASADQKADIKKSLTILVIGAAIVFGTTLVIDFVQNIADDLLKVY